MADWFRLHLTFDPALSPETLGAVKQALVSVDYDAPVGHIGVNGTEDGRNTSTGTWKGEAWASWRSPMFEIQDHLPDILAKAGASGHGWLNGAISDDWNMRVEDRDRFTFGTGQEVMQARIQKATALNNAEIAVCRAEREVMKAARKDGLDMVACVRVLREADKALAALRETSEY